MLVDLTGAALIQRLAPRELSDTYIQETWITVPGVEQFEKGHCDEQTFAQSVIDFYGLDCTPDYFAQEILRAAERKFEGVDPFLEALSQDYALACLTNTNPLQWPKISGEFGLGKFFPRQYVSYELGLMKPDPAIYQYVLRDTELPPAEILFIDDNVHNCKAARDLGFAVCQVTGFEDARSQVLARVNE